MQPTQHWRDKLARIIQPKERRGMTNNEFMDRNIRRGKWQAILGTLYVWGTLLAGGFGIYVAYWLLHENK